MPCPARDGSARDAPEDRFWCRTVEGASGKEDTAHSHLAIRQRAGGYRIEKQPAETRRLSVLREDVRSLPKAPRPFSPLCPRETSPPLPVSGTLRLGGLQGDAERVGTVLPLRRVAPVAIPAIGAGSLVLAAPAPSGVQQGRWLNQPPLANWGRPGMPLPTPQPIAPGGLEEDRPNGRRRISPCCATQRRRKTGS